MSVQEVPISFEVDGLQLQDFNEVLMNRWKRANSLRRPLQRIAEYMLEEIDRNFTRRGVVFGAAWRRRKRSYPHNILHKSGRMRGDFHGVAHNDRAVIKNKTPYFKYHQLGTRHMPSRKMWGITDLQAREIRQQIQEYLVEEGRR